MGPRPSHPPPASCRKTLREALPTLARMPSIESKLQPTSDAFAANRASMLAQIERVRSAERRAVDTSAASRARFEKRGQLLPRERLSVLLDPGTPFLELCTLAGLGMDVPDVDASVPGAVGSSPASAT